MSGPPAAAALSPPPPRAAHLAAGTLRTRFIVTRVPRWALRRATFASLPSREPENRLPFEASAYDGGTWAQSRSGNNAHPPAASSVSGPPSWPRGVPGSVVRRPPNRLGAGGSLSSRNRLEAGRRGRGAGRPPRGRLRVGLRQSGLGHWAESGAHIRTLLAPRARSLDSPSPRSGGAVCSPPGTSNHRSHRVPSMGAPVRRELPQPALRPSLHRGDRSPRPRPGARRCSRPRLEGCVGPATAQEPEAWRLLPGRQSCPRARLSTPAGPRVRTA